MGHNTLQRAWVIHLHPSLNGCTRPLGLWMTQMANCPQRLKLPCWFYHSVLLGAAISDQCDCTFIRFNLIPSWIFFCFPLNEHNKKGRNVTSRGRIQTPMIVHCLHLFIRFSVFSFFYLLDRIHTNEIQAYSVNNNEKVNSFYREASAC